MSVPERRLAILILSWRQLADDYDQGIGHASEYSEAVRRALADNFRMHASMLEQATMLCAVCTGRGFEFSPAFEDEPAGWFPCSMCKGMGFQPHRVSCVRCADVEIEGEMCELSGELVCSSCYYMNTHLGPDKAMRLTPPFGPHRFF